MSKHWVSAPRLATFLTGTIADSKASCPARKLLSEDVIWGYLTQITLALDDCHSHKTATGNRKEIILHRDIKPENGQCFLAVLTPIKTYSYFAAVFLDKNNNLKLGDFGLSKAMQYATMTQTYVGVRFLPPPRLGNRRTNEIVLDLLDTLLHVP